MLIIYSLSLKRCVMFKDTKTFSSFSVDNIEKAKQFYGQTLQLNVADNPMGVLELNIAGGNNIMFYPKPNHTPATYTFLNFPVFIISNSPPNLVKRSSFF